MKLKKKIKNTILNCLSLKKKISKKDSFKNDLEADSLDMIEIMMAIEENFNIKIKDKESSKIKTINCLIKLVKKKLKIFK
ncbi:MAG: acyl carrier protein [Buchnera aphidicola (Periphyllus lyropictus)]|uniref:phosphopantetheine-binding protein n=1 Tax=Buchnera aphidicola TaxID=9 RepID=UPI001EC6B40F|nr:phosphopantetheine-binding protein [Buchnera aphidicola]NIH16592.1 acyl carrier protein [Buchnera aphidicola (Periphyllus lyropictus)]USS94482.1 phosphopantetheine-binding protein [Buchnera aphidicola (Periphyllus lyropictus)]